MLSEVQAEPGVWALCLGDMQSTGWARAEQGLGVCAGSGQGGSAGQRELLLTWVPVITLLQWLLLLFPALEALG